MSHGNQLSPPISINILSIVFHKLSFECCHYDPLASASLFVERSLVNLPWGGSLASVWPWSAFHLSLHQCDHLRLLCYCMHKYNDLLVLFKWGLFACRNESACSMQMLACYHVLHLVRYRILNDIFEGSMSFVHSIGASQHLACHFVCLYIRQ